MVGKRKAIRRNFDFAFPEVNVSFVQGEDAEAMYKEVSKTIKSGLWFDEPSLTMQGSSTFIAARVDSIVRNLGKGIRVANLRDLSRPEIGAVIVDRYYADTPAIVFRSMKDGFEPNANLIKTLAPLIEQRAGRLELPVLVTGFDVKASKDAAGYGLELVPREDFAVLHDERLKEKYHGSRFSSVDENGLPNFDSDGSRTWYATDSGLFRLCLGSKLSLDSWCNGGNLDFSYQLGRVVLVRDAVAAEKKSK